MTTDPQGVLTFGLRTQLPPHLAPRPILHAPEGLGGLAAASQMRSVSVVVGVVGLLMLGAYATAGGTHCGEPDPDHPDATPVACQSGSGHGWGGHGWGGHSWGGGESAITFGGFGHAGSAHGGGGE